MDHQKACQNYLKLIVAERSRTIMAIRPCRPGHSALIQSSKQRPKSIGSTRAATAHTGRHDGRARSFAESRDDACPIRRSRRNRHMTRWWRRSEEEALRPRDTRQGSRSSARLEKCFKCKANRARGTPRPRKNRSYRSCWRPFESERRTNHLLFVNAKSSLSRVPRRGSGGRRSCQSALAVVLGPKSLREALPIRCFRLPVPFVLIRP